MIQTQLINVPTQTIPAEGSVSPSLLAGGLEEGVLGQNKAAFSDAMAKAQLMGKTPASQAASHGSCDLPEVTAEDAKSLASADLSADEILPARASGEEPVLPPDDFLQQLQASLRQDVSLVVPAAPALPPGEVAPSVDGNDLPPESLPHSRAAGVMMAGETTSLPAGESGARGEKLAAGPGKDGTLAGAGEMGAPPEEQGAFPPVGKESAIAGAGNMGSQPKDEPSSIGAGKDTVLAGAGDMDTQPKGEPSSLGAGKGIALAGAGNMDTQPKDEPSSLGVGKGTVLAGAGDMDTQPKGEPSSLGVGKGTVFAGAGDMDTQSKDEPSSLGVGKGTPLAGTGTLSPQPGYELAKVPTQEHQGAEPASAGEAKRGEAGPPSASSPLSGLERAAQLAKGPAGEAAPASQAAPQPQLVTDDSQPGSRASEGQGAAPSLAARVFGEGMIRVETQGASLETAQSRAQGESAGVQGKDADGREAEPQARPASEETKGAVSARAESGTSAGSASQAVATPDPVLAAPQQILARHESQGAQAPLTALSAGIEQMESAPVAVGAAVTLKPAAEKTRLSELGKPAGMEVKGTEPGEGSQPLQQAQTQAGDSKPVIDAAPRREPQSLPHLKLATPEAPAQLHQKVNLMLTDKLQQAEIQLDPLGLGKMKIQIQIQMGADNQASVHFVVQHGQTREMLEQAMPRLRDMLAGQGIQLGQTQVQQQSQQQSQQQGQPQSQGQSAFGGQGQQGGGSFGGRNQGEADQGARSLSLLVESANDAGIDFYA